MRASETFVVVDWSIGATDIEDHVVFIGNEDDARRAADQRSVMAGIFNPAVVMAFADFCYDVRREAESDCH